MIFALVSLLIFAAVATLAVGMLLRRKEGDSKSVRERVGGRKSKSTAAALIVERDSRLSNLPFLDNLLRGMSFARRLELLLYQAGSNMRVATFLMAVAVCALGGYLAGYVIFTRLLHAMVFGAIGGFLPVFFLMQKK